MAGKGNTRSTTGSGGGIAPTPKPPTRPRSTDGSRSQQSIPPAVANRMARRIAIATGIPTLLGMSTFVGSYLLVSRSVLDIPPRRHAVDVGGLFPAGGAGAELRRAVRQLGGRRRQPVGA